MAILPHTVYVALDPHAGDKEDLLAWRDPFSAADDEKKKVGIYKLVEIKEMQKVLEIK